MMSSFRQIATSLITIFLINPPVLAADVDAGYDVFAVAQVMIDLSSHSWEWGTAAEALLELYDPELSVFSSNPFPSGKIPNADPRTFALAYAKQFIHTNGQVFVGDSAVGDPASLGVSAILIGQSDRAYLDASNRQADYILNQAPKWSNGAISHRPDVAEIWADNMAMSFPFLAYLAVQQGNLSLMAETVTQCGLQRAVLKTSQFNNWRHIIGPQSQDTGLWSTGNGWASYGMVRVLHTLQKWSGSSSSMTSQIGQLKGWIKEILDGAMLSGLDNGLLRNYLNDDSWFGETSGTALLSAVAYRMAVNDPGMFPKKYITWADTNRKALAQHQNGGVFAPAVNPYSWLDRTKYTKGSPEGQAFMVNLYTAYRDCVGAGVCAAPPSSATTISKGGIGPIEVLTVLDAAITFSAMPVPTGATCRSPASCDSNGSTANTCGPHQSCDLNGCAGAFDGLLKFAQCTGNFEGCECTATANTCGPHQSCDLNGCAGAFDGLSKFAQCTGNFEGCECTATSNTCGPRQSCDLNGCDGAYGGSQRFAKCTGNFVGCDCSSTSNTCGPRQSCDLNGCAGAYDGIRAFAQCSAPMAQCTNFFKGCECTATSKTCGAKQSCDLNGCAGGFDSSGVARCQGNFLGCQCAATSSTCGTAQSCDLNGCNGGFNSQGNAVCMGNFYGCPCIPNPIWIPPPPSLPPSEDPPPSSPSLPPLENPWYCLGIYERDDCNNLGCTRSYALGARNMNTGVAHTVHETGVGHPISDLCGATIDGATIECHGDISAECAPPGIATYNSRTCRSYCHSLGDPVECWNIGNGVFGFRMSMSLVCDRALS
ncbi:hypothetical protein J3F84DRAFT_401419 [Trichoderma pleuroticola]